MITHTQAKDLWYGIMDNPSYTYPFNEALRLNAGRTPLLESIAHLWLYFRDIGLGQLRDYSTARKCFLIMLSFVPEYRLDEKYGELFSYFTQKGLNYTPLNLYKDSLSYLHKKTTGELF